MSKLEEEQILRKAEEIIERRNDERARKLSLSMNDRRIDMKKVSNFVAYYEGARAITEKIKWLLNKKHPRTKVEWNNFLQMLTVACESNGSMNKLMYADSVILC